MLKLSSRTKIVIHSMDVIESSGCHYDIPGHIVFFYNFETDAWIKKTFKYRNSRLIAKREGFCMGGDYGIMKLPRYEATMVFETGREVPYYGILDKIYGNIKNEAETVVKKLNSSGELMISCGDFNSCYDKTKRLTTVTVQRGLWFTAGIRVENYSRDAFIWESKK